MSNSFHLFRGQIDEELWCARHVQEWYNCLREAGHTLKEIKAVEWVKRVGESFPLFVALHAAVAPYGENRVKDNEVAVIRPSTAHVLVWCSAGHPRCDRFLLIKEFRTTAMNSKGFVFELPGGSSFDPEADPLETAKDTLLRETGMSFDASRFKEFGIAQCAPTIVANRAFLVSVRLNREEMDALAKKEGEMHGDEAKTERTYICVKTRAEIMNPANDEFGWDVRGMIAAATFES